MIRYVVDQGAPKPIDDVRCRDLATLGLRRDGAYRAGTRAGEVWVDGDGSTMIAVEPLGFGMTSAAQTVLEDGTHVTTEERPALHTWILLGPGVSLQPDKTSLRFPKVRDVRELLERHREHVAEIVKARGTAARLDGSTLRFTETRNEAQARGQNRTKLQLKLALAFSVLVTFGTSVIGGRLGQARVDLAFAAGFAAWVLGFMFVAPALLHAGLFRKRAARVPVSTARKEEERVVRAWSSRTPYLLGFFALIYGLIFSGAILKGVATSNAVLAAFSLALGVEQMMTAMRSARGPRSRRVTWEVTGRELRVEGERPLPLADIGAALRNDVEQPSLFVVDRRGKVALRLTGPAEMLDELRDQIAPERVSLPVTGDHRWVFALVVPLLISLVGGWLAPAHASAIYTAGMATMMLGPLSHLRRRRGVQAGLDGIVVDGRFIAFTEIASLSTTAERLELTEKNGRKADVVFALPGSASEVARRWHAHSQRAEMRDEQEVARRRIAVDQPEDQVPYRARVLLPEELGEALLDSAENKSLRVRAARRLARDEGEAAARIREQVEERVVDPDVRQELGGSKGSKGSTE